MRSEEIELAIKEAKRLIDFWNNYIYATEEGKVDCLYSAKSIETVLNYISELERTVKIKNGDIEVIQRKIDKHFIDRSVIVEKIKELLKKLNEPNNDRWEKDDNLYYEKIKIKIQILKELLENKNERYN